MTPQPPSGVAGGNAPATAAALLIHDLRNALAVLEAAALGLSARAGLSPELREDLTLLGRLAQRTTGLARQLLPEPLSVEASPHGLDRHIRALAPELRLAAGPDLRLGLRLSAPSAGLAAPAALDRLLMNLVTNARAALVKGHVTIRTSAVPSGAVIEIEDDGPGLPTAVLARLTAASSPPVSAEGHGLGLASVAALAEALGGKLQVETGPTGSLFRIEIRSDRPQGQGRSVLLIEDDATLRDFLTMLLREDGWSPRPFDSAEKAWAAIRSNAAAPSAVVTDHRLAGNWSGETLLLRLRQLWPGLPAILLSGGAIPVVTSLADVLPLAKPVESGVLLAALRGMATK
jgi:CheY-like chemotaxis protein